MARRLTFTVLLVALPSCLRAVQEDLGGRRHGRTLMRGEQRQTSAANRSVASKAAAVPAAASPDVFQASVGSCRCDLRELTCLPTSDCLEPFFKSPEKRIALGVEVRKRLKSSISWAPSPSLFYTPLGKAFQYNTIDAWKKWVSGDTVPSGRTMATGLFESKWYPYCKEHGLSSDNCLFDRMNETEDLSETERDAVALGSSDGSFAAVASTAVAEMDRLREAKGVASPNADAYLLSFAHFMRMEFNIRQSTRELYESKLRTVAATKSGSAPKPLKVALHVRRADSCRQLKREQYESTASGLDFHAQVSGQRVCYQTQVYVAALKQLMQAYQKPLEVFLSTDDTLSVLQEVEGGEDDAASDLPKKQMLFGDASSRDVAVDADVSVHRQRVLSGERVLGAFRSEDADFYHATTWRILNYSRDAFKYEGFIESTTKPFMSETAVMDLWHLSHGEAFVGQLGSRFGKVGYFLAVARQNSALPYVTVDGHNLCCEVDEVCATANGAIKSMTNCLTFGHELVAATINKDYWQVGSTVRGKVS